ncbi:MAG: hypothetical protein PW735_08230 [Acidobacteriaceae bacterium]|nr:hypothetical protein [Acidobacteriaceae bacterium]
MVRKFCGVMLFAAMASVAAAQSAEPTASEAASLVQVETKGNQAVSASTFTLQVDGRTTPIQGLSPIQPQNLEVALLIDDGARRGLSLQLGDLDAFIKELPPGVKVLVGYMSNGTVMSVGRFSADKEAVAKQLRIPFGIPGLSASPYFCLSEFVKHWPSNVPAARIVLMITNGVDLYNGSTSIMNQNSPYVQTAGDDAQRAGVVVYPLYYGDAGIYGMRNNFSGQSYLQQIADATGGESLYGGTITPVSFKPYLDTFVKQLEGTYVMNFQLPPVKREHSGSLLRMHVKSNEKGIKVRSPQNVVVEGVE